MVMTSLEEVDIFKDAMHLVYWRHVPSWLLVRGDAGEPSIVGKLRNQIWIAVGIGSPMTDVEDVHC